MATFEFVAPRRSAETGSAPTSSDISSVLVEGPLCPFADAYSGRLEGCRSSRLSAVNLQRQVAQLSGWLAGEGVAVEQLNEASIEAFLAPNARAAATGPQVDMNRVMSTSTQLDETGMLGTDGLDRLVGLARSQQWRLVLVGDRCQLQAVGRGGMFDHRRVRPADLESQLDWIADYWIRHDADDKTVDVSYTLIIPGTSHRALYVGATRGRTVNHSPS